MMWAPWLRHQQKVIGRPFIVSCEAGKGALYDDFATVREVPTAITDKRDCQHGWVNGEKVGKRFYGGMIGTDKDFISPLDLQVQWAPGGPPTLRYAKWQSMRKEIEHGSPPPIIGIHARMLDRVNLRNWPEKKWDELMESIPLGWHCSVFGSKADAYRPSHHIVDDWRGCDIGTVRRRMSLCKVIIGPSSGPLHLANLCEVPVVWWSANAKDVERYATAWNPFKCDNVCASKTWKPTPKEVLKCVMNAIRS